MDSAYTIFGHGPHITGLQMTARAALAFFIALALIRAGGVRMFGRKTAVDDIIVIMLGAILSRGVVAANNFLSTVEASAVLVVIHRLLSFITTKYKRPENILKGKRIVLYSNGKIHHKNLVKTSISEEDLLQSIRLETQQESYDGIDTAYLENNGRISFIKKISVV